MSTELATPSSPSAAPALAKAAVRPRALWAMVEVRWAVAATVLFAAGAGLQVSGLHPATWWTMYLAACVAGGWEPALAGLQELRDKTLDVDLLMVVAAVLAAAIGQIFEAALLIVIFATSGALEAVVTRRTADSVRALLELAPERADRLLEGDVVETVDTAELAVGDLVLVRPGERIGADGVVVGGASEVDQASVTGEPLPVFKQSGDEVFAGTLNGAGALRVEVSRRASESVVARIVALVEQASATKAQRQLFIEAVEQRYSVGVVVATLALFVVPLALGSTFESTLLRAMTFMIVASPCAVVLATMPPLLSAIANAGRHGVLVKSAVVMETLRTATIAVFDKTGTLTQGTPVVTDIHVLGRGTDADEALMLAAGAESPSEHPVGRAIVAAAAERGVQVPAATAFTSEPGVGVRAIVDGRGVEVGSPRLLNESPGDAEVRRAAAQHVSELQDAGRTAVIVAVDGNVRAVLGLSDRLRPDAKETVVALAAITGHQPIVLTGDNVGAAHRLAAELGLSDVRAGLLPAGKVAAVRALQDQGHTVLLVGDGVNDAPAMAAADIGLAMGGHGSDLALETADAVIVRDELATIANLMGMSRRAHRVVMANLAVAGAVITALVAWDVLGTLPLPLGVAGHEGSTVVVGLNGLRLLRRAAWRQADAVARPRVPSIRAQQTRR